MTLGIIRKSFSAWLGILIFAVANGALRDTFLIPVLGKAPGLILSGILLSMFILIAAYFALPWFGQTSSANYIIIGASWLALTLAFEFTFGYLVQGKSWPVLLEAYTLKEGNIWLIVLAITATAPYIAAKFKGWV